MIPRPEFDLGSTVAFVASAVEHERDNGGQGEDFGKSSPVGLVVLILFFVAVFFLVRSMNKHLKKLPARSTSRPIGPRAASHHEVWT